MHRIFHIYFICILTILLGSCSKKEQEVPKADPVPYKEGFIRATIDGEFIECSYPSFGIDYKKDMTRDMDFNYHFCDANRTNCDLHIGAGRYDTCLCKSPNSKYLSFDFQGIKDTIITPYTINSKGNYGLVMSYTVYENYTNVSTYVGYSIFNEVQLIVTYYDGKRIKGTFDGMFRKGNTYIPVTDGEFDIQLIPKYE